MPRWRSLFARAIFLSPEAGCSDRATPLLALASVLATCVCATALCPFEAVGILSVRAGESSAAALHRMRRQLETAVDAVCAEFSKQLSIKIY